MAKLRVILSKEDVYKAVQTTVEKQFNQKFKVDKMEFVTNDRTGLESVEVELVEKPL